jgi:hypothetical protein
VVAVGSGPRPGARVAQDLHALVDDVSRALRAQPVLAGIDDEVLAADQAGDLAAVVDLVRASVEVS